MTAALAVWPWCLGVFLAVAWVSAYEAPPSPFKGLLYGVLITVTPIYAVCMLVWVAQAGGSPS